MSSQDSFDALMVKLQAGDDAAAARVFERFAEQLIQLARSRLPGGVRTKVDPEDVLQSVFRSFFLRQRAGQFTLANWDSLWGLLTVLTLRKCGHRVGHYRAARRDARREVPLLPEGEPDAVAIFSRVPTPEEAVALTDLVERVMAGLEERDRTILTLHLQGCTVPEISERVGRAERTVGRTLERVRKRLRRLYGDDAAPVSR